MKASSQRNLELVVPHQRDEQPALAPRSFGNRLLRAAGLLVAAIAAHVWIVPAHTPTPLPAGDAASDAPSALRNVAESIARAAVDSVNVEHLTLAAADLLPARFENPPATQFASARNLDVDGRHGVVRAAMETLASAPGGSDSPAPLMDAMLVEPAAFSVPVGTVGRASDLPGAFVRPAAPPTFTPPSPVPPQRSPGSHAAPRTVHLADTPPPVDHDRVLYSIVQRYAQAYERKDVMAAKAVYPTVNDRGLRRAFRDIDRAQVTIGDCRMNIEGADARVSCQGDATYHPRVGSKAEHVLAEWQFTFARADAGWQIVDLKLARPE